MLVSSLLSLWWNLLSLRIIHTRHAYLFLLAFTLWSLKFGLPLYLHLLELLAIYNLKLAFLEIFHLFTLWALKPLDSSVPPLGGLAFLSRIFSNLVRVISHRYWIWDLFDAGCCGWCWSYHDCHCSYSTSVSSFRSRWLMVWLLELWLRELPLELRFLLERVLVSSWQFELMMVVVSVIIFQRRCIFSLQLLFRWSFDVFCYLLCLHLVLLVFRSSTLVKEQKRGWRTTWSKDWYLFLKHGYLSRAPLDFPLCPLQFSVFALHLVPQINDFLLHLAVSFLEFMLQIVVSSLFVFQFFYQVLRLLAILR